MTDLQNNVPDPAEILNAVRVQLANQGLAYQDDTWERLLQNPEGREAASEGNVGLVVQLVHAGTLPASDAVRRGGGRPKIEKSKPAAPAAKAKAKAAPSSVDEAEAEVSRMAAELVASHQIARMLEAEYAAKGELPPTSLSPITQDADETAVLDEHGVSLLKPGYLPYWVPLRDEDGHPDESLLRRHLRRGAERVKNADQSDHVGRLGQAVQYSPQAAAMCRARALVDKVNVSQDDQRRAAARDEEAIHEAERRGIRLRFLDPEDDDRARKYLHPEEYKRPTQVIRG